MLPNQSRLSQAFHVLTTSLGPHVESVLMKSHGHNWWKTAVLDQLKGPNIQRIERAGKKSPIEIIDAALALAIIKHHWKTLFERTLGSDARNYIFEAADLRNKNAHATGIDLSDRDLRRAMDTIERILEHVDPSAAAKVKAIAKEPPIAVAQAKATRPSSATPITHAAGPRRSRGTTSIGYANKNGQSVVRKTDLPGNDHNQVTYVLRCSKCSAEYGSNGSDVWQRRCPECGGGRPGLPIK